MAEAPVRLYVYDLTNGMARQLGTMLLGRPLDGIWHTSVVVYGVEYYFSGFGVETAVPGATHHGTPVRVDDMGTTQVSQELFHEYLVALEEFGAGRYHLLDRNCNHFSDRACEFLVGRGIDPTIVSLPSDLINTPMGQMVRPFIERVMGPSQIPSAMPSLLTAHGVGAHAKEGPDSTSAANAESHGDVVHLSDVEEFVPHLATADSVSSHVAGADAALIFFTDTRKAACNALNAMLVEAAMSGGVACAYVDADKNADNELLKKYAPPTFVGYRRGVVAEVLASPEPAQVHTELAAFLRAAESESASK